MMKIRNERNSLAMMILLGGILVLASYVIVFSQNPETIQAMWGGVPDALLPLYQANMIWAAAGYFFFTLFFLFRIPAGAAGHSKTVERRLLFLFYALILLPSALWTPLALVMVLHPSGLTWLAIRFVLFMVGAGSVGLLYLLIRARPVKFDLYYFLAFIGLIGFNLQTAVLDAFIWPYYFTL